jgi:hypothetical protein
VTDDFNARSGERATQLGGVRIDDLTQEQLGADGDDFELHSRLVIRAR